MQHYHQTVARVLSYSFLLPKVVILLSAAVGECRSLTSPDKKFPLRAYTVRQLVRIRVSRPLFVYE